MKPASISRCLAALSCLFSLAASAADTIDEIIVTADFRQRPATELTASVTILDADDIENRAVQHFEELIGAVPNLNWSGDGHRARYFQMRGVGELEQYQGAPNPSVGLLIDDIDFSGIGTIATLFDLQRVEVLRGPQGTRYGANALAGLIYMQSSAPTAEFDGRVELTAGDDGLFGGGIAIGGALDDADRITGRFSAHHLESDGFRKNTYLGRDDTNRRDETTVRGRLNWTAGTAWDMNLAVLFADVDNGYDAFAIDNSLTMLSDKPGKDAQESVGASFRADYAGFAGATLTSITSLANSDIEFSFDADWGNDDSWAPVLYDYVSVSDRKRRTASQEIRLVADGWLAGIYALRLDDEVATLNRGEYYDPGYDFADSLDDLFESDYRATNFAGFGEIDRGLGEATRLTLGLRLERRTTDYDDSAGLIAGPAETLWGGELALSHEHTDTLSSFVSLSRGYKAGGFNLGPAVPDAYRDFGAETLWNLEAGIKSTLIGGNLRFNASVFASRHEDQQVRTSFQLDPGDPTSFGFVTVNVEKSDTLGAEADLRWLPGDAWSFYATVGLLDTEFGRSLTASLLNLEGRAQAHAPGFTAAVGGSFAHPSGVFGRLDVTARDDFYFDVSHDERSEPYELVNARLGYRAADWSIALWARNLFAKAYAVRGFFFGNEPPDFPNTLYTRQGDPRLLGVTFEKRF